MVGAQSEPFRQKPGGNGGSRGGDSNNMPAVHPFIQSNETVRRQDYQSPSFAIDLRRDSYKLDDADTRVTSEMEVRRTCDSTGEPLVLNGDQKFVTLKSIKIDGRKLGATEFQLTEKHLVVPNVPGQFKLEIETTTSPNLNTTGMGLYKSDHIFVTKNEPDGMQRITYCLDRPDVMTQYITTVAALKSTHPVLLSNGAMVASGDLPDGYHFVTWQDRFPKPTYLFALVAGDLVEVQDVYIAASGRKIPLTMFIEKGDQGRCGFALNCLKNAMWHDEYKNGLTCYLDEFKLVAVRSYNAAATEFSGLNIFRASQLLLDPQTSVDAEYDAAERLVAHEYFHTWTGNRVTIRTAHETSLKEGWTRYRDRVYAATQSSEIAVRIQDVWQLRTYQFSDTPEAVRPDEYKSLRSLYSRTAYDKGAEVIRMLVLLVGEKAYQQGSKLFFDKHDWSGATWEDLLSSMEQASQRDLTQFKRWLTQPGTPTVAVKESYDQATASYKITFTQNIPGPGITEPLHIPIDFALFDGAGNQLPLRLKGESTAHGSLSRVLELTMHEQTFEFVGVKEKPISSVFRNFSAPVRLEQNRSDQELLALFAHDTDAFNRYDAGQTFALARLRELTLALRRGENPQVDEKAIETFGNIIKDRSLGVEFKHFALTLPGDRQIADRLDWCDYENIEKARRFLNRTIAERYREDLLTLHAELSQGLKQFEDLHGAEARALRRLKNRCVAMIGAIGDQEAIDFVSAQFKSAVNMTDQIEALRAISHTQCPERESAFLAFYEKWKGDYRVMNHWLGLQSLSVIDSTIDNLKLIAKDAVFDIRSQDFIEKTYLWFALGNLSAFHNPSGEGYKFIADKIIEIDQFNPTQSSYIARAFSQVARMDQSRQALMREQINRILEKPDLSDNVRDILAKLK